MIIPVKTQLSGYDIILNRGALSQCGECLNLNRKVLIVTDDGVPKDYSERVAEKCLYPYTVTLPQGETSKNFDNYSYLLKVMCENGFTRSDCVTAVGGGVIGDMAGFAAATYMRGIDFYNIPTTLLSQVDSSVGGKTAIDFCGYKNIVGAFYQPKCVIIDPDTLLTLPERQINNGLAEAFKMSLTSSKELFGIFKSGKAKENIDEVIRQSVSIKRDVVQKDEKEQGLRKVLNFGHTVGHAVESADGMKTLYHGECVAIGMLPMCSEKLRPEVRNILISLGLPVSANISADKLINAAKHDKKKSGDKISVVTVDTPGSFKIKDINFSDFEKMLRELEL